MDDLTSPFDFADDELDVPDEVVDAVFVLRDVARLILDADPDDEDLRATIFEQIPREEIEAAYEVTGAYLAARGVLPRT